MKGIFVIAGLFRVLWPAIVFGTAAYAVFWLGHTGWWFLLAILIAAW